MNQHRQRNARVRPGSTVTEVIVAAVLLSAMVSVAATSIVRSGRIWRQTQHVQLCMDELSNQMERLISLAADDRRAAIADLAPSTELKSTLPHATLTSETFRDDGGIRLVLSLHWQDVPGAVPTQLVGWIDPFPGVESSDGAESSDEVITEQGTNE